MKAEKILEHIDNKILSNLKTDFDLYKTLIHLDFLVDTFSKKDSYVKFSEVEIKKNWNNIPIRTRYTSYYVISCMKRINDIKWILSKNLEMDDKMKFKLIILKSKINAN